MRSPGQPASHAGRQETHQGTRTRVAAQRPGAGRNGNPLGAVKKSRGDLQQGRGRMIVLEDRQALARGIDVAHTAGARLKLACETAGIDLRTLQRWKAFDGLVGGDGRPHAVRATPSHALSEVERAQVLAVANEPRFAAVPPARIVPMLADEGVYLASESSFSRVLREQGQTAHRGRAKAPRAVCPPTTHIATAPRQVWCWDMTYLPAVVMGRWFYLYLILDLYSRKIVGWEVHATDHADHAAHLLRRTALAEGIAALAAKPVLHGDNGATPKATELFSTQGNHRRRSHFYPPAVLALYVRQREDILVPLFMAHYTSDDCGAGHQICALVSSTQQKCGSCDSSDD